MDYTLVLPNGKTMEFYLQEIAELYQRLYGGILLKKGRPALRLVDKLAA